MINYPSDTLHVLLIVKETSQSQLSASSLACVTCGVRPASGCCYYGLTDQFY